MYRLYDFNMLFQLVLTKFFQSELLSCLPKVDHVILPSASKSLLSLTEKALNYNMQLSGFYNNQQWPFACGYGELAGGLEPIRNGIIF